MNPKVRIWIRVVLMIVFLMMLIKGHQMLENQELQQC